MPCEGCSSPVVSNGLCKACVDSARYLTLLRARSGEGTAAYFDEESYVGSRTFKVSTHGGSNEPYSAYTPCVAYFCPVCGKLWGREVPNFSFQYRPTGSMPEWKIVVRTCVEHGDGQFLQGLDNLDGCSKELLNREFLALLQRYES